MSSNQSTGPGALPARALLVYGAGAALAAAGTLMAVSAERRGPVDRIDLVGAIESSRTVHVSGCSGAVLARLAHAWSPLLVEPLPVDPGPSGAEADAVEYSSVVEGHPEARHTQHSV